VCDQRAHRDLCAVRYMRATRGALRAHIFEVDRYASGHGYGILKRARHKQRVCMVYMSATRRFGALHRATPEVRRAGSRKCRESAIVF